MLRKLISVISASVLLSDFTVSYKNSEPEYPDGWLLWHSYSEYSAMDSELFLRKPCGDIIKISGDFVNPMNADFGNTPRDIVFMAIDKDADEWDIFRYDLYSDKTENLTEKSGFRNEDPKYSPDGNKIVFKRGSWNSSINDFEYNLYEYSFADKKTVQLTDDIYEEAMPFYSADGRYIYYSLYRNGISSIHALDTETGKTEEIYSEENVTAYYPVVSGESLYFTKWNSSENRNDMIVKTENNKTVILPFNSPEINCSDACPVNEDEIIYSSTENGNYDLFCFRDNSSIRMDFSVSEKNELGAAFYSEKQAEEYLHNLSDFLLGDKKENNSFDFDCDGITDVYDLIAARRLFSE